MSVYTAFMKQGFMSHLSGRMEGVSGTLAGQRRIIFFYRLPELWKYELKNQQISFLKLGKMP